MRIAQVGPGKIEVGAETNRALEVGKRRARGPDAIEQVTIVVQSHGVIGCGRQCPLQGGARVTDHAQFGLRDAHIVERLRMTWNEDGDAAVALDCLLEHGLLVQQQAEAKMGVGHPGLARDRVAQRGNGLVDAAGAAEAFGRFDWRRSDSAAFVGRLRHKSVLCRPRRDPAIRTNCIGHIA